MKKHLSFFILTVLFFPLSGFCKEITEIDTIVPRFAFADLDINDLELLSKETRLDMLDYFDVDSIVKMPNNMGGLSWIESLTPDFMQVHLTDASTLQLKTLGTSSGHFILMALYTTGRMGDTQDTEVRFYDPDLNRLDGKKLLPIPSLKDLVTIPGNNRKKLEEIEKILPFHSIVFVADPVTNKLTATLSLGDILSIEDRDKIAPFLKPAVYTWNGKKFILN